MAKFRKKPVVIEAVQLTGIAVIRETPWLAAAREMDWGPGAVRLAAATDHLEIATLEGVHLASPGDWIIRGIEGELYPCKNEIFRLTYEEADDAAR